MEQDCALRPGTVIHGPERDYTIISKLGQGGFGITYLVEADVTIGNITAKVRFALKEHFIGSLCDRADDTVTVSFSKPVAGEITARCSHSSRKPRACSLSASAIPT